MELCEECRLDPFAGLVPGPEIVSERLDDVIGRDADVRRSLFEHLKHGLQHADHGAERTILPFVEAAQSVEVPKQLIRAVDDVHDHVPPPRAFDVRRSDRATRLHSIRISRSMA